MRRNLTAALFEHETISTTPEKAKDVRAFAERLITLAKKGTLAARRRAIAMLGDRDIMSYEESKAVRKGTIVGKLFSELGPRYLDRPGGYTRIVRLSLRKLGDSSRLVLLQLVGEQETTTKEPKKPGRRKRAKRLTEETARAETGDVPQGGQGSTEEPQGASAADARTDSEE
jgi:large subunit ribosomal protein L17